jgi:hypothetical protein
MEKIGSEPRWPSGARARQGEAAVKEFFDRFARALSEGDARALSWMWEAPALVVADQEVHAIASVREVETFFAGAREQYNLRGIMEARPQIVRLDWPTDRIALVEVRWPYVNAQGHETGAESSTYTLRRDDAGELRLRAVVMHGAVTRH